MKKFEKKSAGPLERLRLKSGIYAASFTVLAILLAVLLNLIVRAVPAKYTEFDLRRRGFTPSATAPRRSPGALRRM